MPYLFAFGTYRQGGSDNNLIADAVLLGCGETTQEYALCLVRNKPLVIKRPVSTIKGEVYTVADGKLALMDRLEGHPRVNQRELVPVKLEDGKVVDAWLYFHIQPLRDSVVVESGVYAGLKS